MLKKGTTWPASVRLVIGAAGMLLSTGVSATSTAVVDAAVLLPEVIVTARRIAENLQDVPLSVQVLTGEYLESSRATRLHELQFAIPGLVINNTGMFGVGFSLRGIADQRTGGLAVAPYFDGVYLGTSNLAIARMFDIERMEILKGPQGTLYGRNATGGSINVIPREPADVLESAIEVSYGSFDTTRAQGYVNLPAGKTALRIAFIASEGDGHIRNTVDDRRFGEEDYWGVRGSLRVDATEDFRIDLMAQHVRDDGGSGDLWLPRPDYLPDPRDIRLTTVTLRDPYLTSEVDQVAARLEFDLGAASLKSITGFTRSEVRNVDDCAGTPVLRGCVRSALPNAFEGWSQELQVLFSRSSVVEGIVGAYYAEDDSTLAFFQLLPLVSTQPTNESRSTTRDRVAALFGQGTVQFADRWSATAGLRLSREESRVTTAGTGTRDSPVPLTGDRNQDDVSWRLDLARAIGDHASVYGGVSTGTKSGGFVTTTMDGYGPESLTAYEIGAKTRWLDRRLTLNAAAFFYDYEDLQVNTISDVGVNQVDNAAEAELYGLDAELSFAPSERWSLSAGFVWLPKREFVEYRTEATGSDLSGNELVRAPEWSLSTAIDYGWPLRDAGRLSARLEYNFRSDYYYTPENDPLLAQDSVGLLNAFLRFASANEAWYAFAAARNLTDADYFTQVLLQSSPGYARTYEVGVGRRF